MSLYSCSGMSDIRIHMIDTKKESGKRTVNGYINGMLYRNCLGMSAIE